MAIEQVTLTDAGQNPVGSTSGDLGLSAVVKEPTRCLRTFALAAVADLVGSGDTSKAAGAEHAFLLKHVDCVDPDRVGWTKTLETYLRRPSEEDKPLLSYAHQLSITYPEILTVSLAAAAEDDLMVGRAIAMVQTPLGGSRPTLGLVATMLQSLMGSSSHPVNALLTGVAVESGLLTIADGRQPVAERSVSIPAHLQLALCGRDGVWPGGSIGLGDTPVVPLPPSVHSLSEHHGRSLRMSSEKVLVVRNGSPAEGKSVALLVAQGLNLRPLFIRTDSVAGVSPWVHLRRLLPVFCYELAPGERKMLPALPYYNGPILVLCGPDGTIETPGGSAMSWAVGVPDADERLGLWRQAIGDGPLAQRLAERHRHGSGRIAHIGRIAHHYALLNERDKSNESDMRDACWVSEGSGLGATAEPMRGSIDDKAMIMMPNLKTDLDALVTRCNMRDGLQRGLGASVSARYLSGVRALFVGPSGTGKTLAVSWLATKLQLPLYRVDLASITSKYIGETEKNLSQLLAAAEHSEVVLLFDEADSLFGKRTDVQQANDRFANAQTNFLLQRIETYEGIVILTSNSRARFDSAFARRLDLIIEFPLPSPVARRALWCSHLGDDHEVSAAALNRLAALADLTGGHIRSAVLAAAALAKGEGRKIQYADVATSLAREFRKLDRQMPVELEHN